MTAPAPIPSGLRERVLAASRAARGGGRSAPAPAPISAGEALRRAAAAFASTLSGLTPDQWRTPVLRDLDVQGLVGHLTGVECDVQRALAGDEAVADADHIASTQLSVTAQSDRWPEQTVAEWQAAVEQTLATVTTGRFDGAVVAMHGMRLSADALLVVRAFELWTHENDVRRAVGLPRSAPDASTLALMTQLAVELLPHGARRAGTASLLLDLHLVLTGTGGGTWDVRIGDADDGSEGTEVMVVVDAVDFCRLVANRVDPASLDLHVRGGDDDAQRVLAAAAALALD